MVLLVMMSVQGWGWSNPCKIIFFAMALHALIKTSCSFLSAADDITALIICSMLRMASLCCGLWQFLVRKWCSFALLCAFFSFKYCESLQITACPLCDDCFCLWGTVVKKMLHLVQCYFWKCCLWGGDSTEGNEHCEIDCPTIIWWIVSPLW